MIQIDRYSQVYTDNVIDPLLAFDNVSTWTVIGTGTATVLDTQAFTGSKSLRLQNLAPTTDLTANNTSQETYPIKKTGKYNFTLSLYNPENETIDLQVQLYSGVSLLDTQDINLDKEFYGTWVSFVGEKYYELENTDKITFKFILKGNAGFGTAKNVFIDGIKFYAINENVFAPPIYTKPILKTPIETLGIYDYNDDATSTTPISLTANTWTHVTNDGAGANTNKTYALTDVSDIYDTSTGLFDFSDLVLGDVIGIRFDAEITTTGANETCDVDLVLAYGTGSEYRIPFIRNEFKTSEAHRINMYNEIYIGNTETLNNSARFEIRSDGNNDVEVFGWYCKVNKRLV